MQLQKLLEKWVSWRSLSLLHKRGQTGILSSETLCYSSSNCSFSPFFPLFYLRDFIFFFAVTGGLWDLSSLTRGGTLAHGSERPCHNQGTTMIAIFLCSSPTMPGLVCFPKHSVLFLFAAWLRLMFHYWTERWGNILAKNDHQRLFQQNKELQNPRFS